MLEAVWSRGERVIHLSTTQPILLTSNLLFQIREEEEGVATALLGRGSIQLLQLL